MTFSLRLQAVIFAKDWKEVYSPSVQNPKINVGAEKICDF